MSCITAGIGKIARIPVAAGAEDSFPNTLPRTIIPDMIAVLPSAVLNSDVTDSGRASVSIMIEATDTP